MVSKCVSDSRKKSRLSSIRTYGQVEAMIAVLLRCPECMIYLISFFILLCLLFLKFQPCGLEKLRHVLEVVRTRKKYSEFSTVTALFALQLTESLERDEKFATFRFKNQFRGRSNEVDVSRLQEG
jgi:hypothetical protein